MKPAALRSVLALALALVTAAGAAHAQQPSALPPVPPQATRRTSAFQSALSSADLTRALRAWIPDAQLNDIDQTSGDTALTWTIGGLLPRPVQRFFVHRMLARGAHPNAPDHHGWTPLSQAIAAGDAELVRALLARGVPAAATWGRDEPMSVLFQVCVWGQGEDYARELRWRADVLLELFRAGAPFETATFGGGASRYPAQGPIDRCATPPVPPLAALFALAGARHHVAAFLPRNAALPAPDRGALEAQVAALPNPPRVDHGAFFEAVARASLPQATAALPAAPVVDAIDRNTGATPLTWVAHQGRLAASVRDRLLALLLERGASVNAQDLDGDTALHAAVENGWVAGVRALLARGASTELRNRSGFTPAHNLCVLRPATERAMRGPEAIEIARLLVAAHADVNALGGAQQGYRRTPLDGCTNDNHGDRSEVRAVLGAAGGRTLRPVGLARSGAAGELGPDADNAP